MKLKQLQPRRVCWKKISKKLHSIMSRAWILRLLQHHCWLEGNVTNKNSCIVIPINIHWTNLNSMIASIGYLLNICSRVKHRQDVPFPPSVAPRVFTSQDSFNLNQSLIDIWKLLTKMKSRSPSEKGLQSVASSQLLLTVKEFHHLIMPGHLLV